MSARSNTLLLTVVEKVVAPEPITRDDFIDDLRDAPAAPDHATGKHARRRRSTPPHDRVQARSRAYPPHDRAA